MPDVGKKAPDFTLKNHEGTEVSLSDFTGNNVVLYFYPKDDTPGCTTEACGFRDAHDRYRNLGAVVIGISRDDTGSHRKFREKYDLPFILLSDPDLDAHKKYNTWVEKKMYGKTYMGTQRATFIINKAGFIHHIFPNVKPKGHADEVRLVLESINMEGSEGSFMA